jgi:hypothetical protein
MAQLIETDKAAVTGNNIPTCRICNNSLERIHRPWLIKILLFWLPLKRYYCYSCLKDRWMLR